MLKYILFALLLLNAILLPAIIEETGSLDGFIYGREPASQYDNWISHLSEGIVTAGYNVYSPWDVQTNGFGGFHVPTATEVTNWGTVIDAFLIQDWELTDQLILGFGFPYQLVQFHDTDTNRTYYMLRENINAQVDANGTLDPYDDETGAFAWGWGLYIFNPNGDHRTIITVPHPCDDFIAPVISTTAFKKLNAEFFMIAGAGREVAWTNVAPYSNAKSISDPTRTTNHPFYPAYTKFCDLIRTESGKREFSVQLHSYDSGLHQNFASVQISAGYNKNCPNLPIRDLSRFKNDMINQGNALMIPANTIGSNSDVYVNDYYTVQYSTHAFTFSDENTTFAINNYLDLPAYSQNVQMNYTLNGWNDYDVFEPFFHAEMDELPNCYVQNDNNYKWFYSWNATTQRWDMSHLFDHALQYYGVWVNNLANVLGATLTMNDTLPPMTPTELVAYNQSYDFVTLQWLKADDFDFDTYEILYSTTPNDLVNFSTYSRTNDPFLASPGCEQINITGLANSVQYYFRIRAKDKNGNYSRISNEVTATTSPAKIVNFRGIGNDNFATIKWGVTSQTNNQGFRIYKYVENVGYELQDSYLTNPALVGGGLLYSWVDSTVTNNTAYTYKLSSVNTNNIEFYHNLTSTCYPRDYFKLFIGYNNEVLVDSLSFSVNPNASMGNDADYDVVKAAQPGSNYVYAGFWEQYWGNNGTMLQQEVYDDFDPNISIKAWTFRVKSDHFNGPITIRVDSTFARFSEKLYLRDNSTGTMTDLEVGPYGFTVPDANYKSFTLYWGNVQPIVTISGLPNRIYQGGSAQYLYWGTSYSFLVDHYNLSIQNDTDSLFVAENLPNTVSNYNFTFPTTANMENAKFVLDASTTDGQLIRKESTYIFGIVPLNVTLANEPGLMMQSNVWANSALNVEGVFGTGALGWTMDSDGNWWQIAPYSFGLGYWIQKTNTFDFNTNLPIQKDSLSFQIRNGWNIVPNPHICAYGIEDLRFRVNNVLYTFAEMQEQNFISRGVYVYRDGQYVLTEVINPYESFLFKFYGTPTMTTTINFIPYNAGPSVAPVTPNWVFKLKGSQTGSDADELILGSNALCSDSYDFKYDLPEPPTKPESGLTRLYLYRAHTDSLFLDMQLNTDYRTPFGDTPNQEKIYNFRMELGNTNPVTFTVDTSLFPDTYGASVHIDDFSYDIQHGNEFVFTPTSAEPINGQIILHNYITGNQDEVMPAIANLIVYPNPFSGSAQIAFNNTAKGEVSVDVYNIKGQHVKTISRGILGKGTRKLFWNGKDDNNISAGTGVYLLKVKTGSKAKTLKMMLIK